MSLQLPSPEGDVTMRIIAHIYTDFPTKFGIPRQSGLAEGLKGRVVFEKEYRRAEAVRGLDEYSHLWLVWYFSQAAREGWSPTVRPPRLGGNRRVGVFASRSPFRPNHIGLSAVRLERVELTDTLGPVLHVAGADMVDGTPIFDVKPYLPFVDAVSDASGGYAERVKDYSLSVDFPPSLLAPVPPDKRDGLLAVLAGDPRPAYQDDPTRVYGFGFAGLEIGFRVSGDRLTVVSVRECVPSGGGNE